MDWSQKTQCLSIRCFMNVFGSGASLVQLNDWRWLYWWTRHYLSECKHAWALWWTEDPSRVYLSPHGSWSTPQFPVAFNRFEVSVYGWMSRCMSHLNTNSYESLFACFLIFSWCFVQSVYVFRVCVSAYAAMFSSSVLVHTCLTVQVCVIWTPRSPLLQFPRTSL